MWSVLQVLTCCDVTSVPSSVLWRVQHKAKDCRIGTAWHITWNTTTRKLHQNPTQMTSNIHTPRPLLLKVAISITANWGRENIFTIRRGGWGAMHSLHKEAVVHGLHWTKHIDTRRPFYTVPLKTKTLAQQVHPTITPMALYRWWGEISVTPFSNKK